MKQVQVKWVSREDNPVKAETVNLSSGHVEGVYRTLRGKNKAYFFTLLDGLKPGLSISFSWAQNEIENISLSNDWIYSQNALFNSVESLNIPHEIYAIERRNRGVKWEINMSLSNKVLENNIGEPFTRLLRKK